MGELRQLLGLVMLALASHGYTFNVGGNEVQNAVRHLTHDQTMTSYTVTSPSMSIIKSDGKNMDHPMQDGAANNNAAAGDRKPTGANRSERLVKINTPICSLSVTIAPARKVTGQIQGTRVKDNFKQQLITTESLPTRQRRNVLESHLSYKDVLAHSHPVPTTGGGNYPKEFGFRDYIRSTSVKRHQPQVGVLVVVDDRVRNKYTHTRRRPIDKLNQTFAISGSGGIFQSFNRQATNTLKSVNVMGESDAVNDSRRNMTVTVDKMSADETRLQNKTEDDVMEEAANMNHDSVDPVGASFFPTTHNNVRREKEEMTSSENRQLKVTWPRNVYFNETELNPGAILPNRSTIKNVPTKYIPFLTTMNDVSTKNWLPNVYRGTIIDVSKTLNLRPTNVNIGSDVLGMNRTVVDDIDSSSSPSNIVESNVESSETVAGKSSYPMYSATQGLHSSYLLPSIYRGTIIDVTSHSPTSQQKNKDSARESEREQEAETTVVVTKVSKTMANREFDNQTKIGDITTLFHSMINSRPIHSIVGTENTNSPTGIEDTAQSFRSSNSSKIDAGNGEFDNQTKIGNITALFRAMINSRPIHSIVGTENTNSPTGIEDTAQSFRSSNGSKIDKDRKNVSTFINENYNQTQFGSNIDASNFDSSKETETIIYIPDSEDWKPHLAGNKDFINVGNKKETKNNTFSTVTYDRMQNVASASNLTMFFAKEGRYGNHSTIVIDENISGHPNTMDFSRNFSTQSGTTVRNVSTRDGTNVRNVSTRGGTNVRNVSTRGGTNVRYVSTQSGTNVRNVSTRGGTNVKNFTLGAPHDKRVDEIIIAGAKQPLASTTGRFNMNDKLGTSNVSTVLDFNSSSHHNSYTDGGDESESMMHSTVVDLKKKPLSHYKKGNNIEKKGRVFSAYDQGTVVEVSGFPYPSQPDLYNLFKKEHYTTIRPRNTINVTHPSQTNTRDFNTKEFLPNIYRGTVIDASKPSKPVRIHTQMDPVDLSLIAGPPYPES